MLLFCVARAAFSARPAISASYSSSVSQITRERRNIGSSIERLPQPFQLRGSATRGFDAVLSYHAVTLITVPLGSNGVTSSW